MNGRRRLASHFLSNRKAEAAVIVRRVHLPAPATGPSPQPTTARSKTSENWGAVVDLMYPSPRVGYNQWSRRGEEASGLELAIGGRQREKL